MHKVKSAYIIKSTCSGGFGFDLVFCRVWVGRVLKKMKTCPGSDRF